MDVALVSLEELGPFVWPADGGNHQMTDMAVDSYGTLFGVSLTHLYTCHPETVECTSLGALPGGYNGLTMLPRLHTLELSECPSLESIDALAQNPSLRKVVIYSCKQLPEEAIERLRAALPETSIN